jgi:predicted metalloendopeptidase
MQNVLLLLQLKVKQNIQLLRETVNRQEWSEFGPTTINAYYNSMLNDISKTSSSKAMHYLHLSF